MVRVDISGSTDHLALQIDLRAASHGARYIRPIKLSEYTPWIGLEKRYCDSYMISYEKESFNGANFPVNDIS